MAKGSPPEPTTVARTLAPNVPRESEAKTFVASISRFWAAVIVTLLPLIVEASTVVCEVARKRLTATRAPALPKSAPVAVTPTRSKTSSPSLVMAIVGAASEVSLKVLPTIFAPATFVSEEPSTVFTRTVADIPPYNPPEPAISIPEFSVRRNEEIVTESIAAICVLPMSVLMALSL